MGFMNLMRYHEISWYIMISMEPMGFMNRIEGESPWRYFELDTRSGDLAWWLGNEIFGQTCGRHNSGRWYIYHIYIWYKWSKSSHSVERNCEWVLCLFLKIGAAVIVWVWVARLDWWRQILLMPQWQTRRARNQPGYASDISNHLSRASTSACCLLTWKLNGWILCPWLEVFSAPPRVVALSRCSGTPAALEIFGDSTGMHRLFSMIYYDLKHFETPSRFVWNMIFSVELVAPAHKGRLSTSKIMFVWALWASTVRFQQVPNITSLSWFQSLRALQHIPLSAQRRVTGSNFEPEPVKCF